MCNTRQQSFYFSEPNVLTCARPRKEKDFSYELSGGRAGPFRWDVMAQDEVSEQSALSSADATNLAECTTNLAGAVEGVLSERVVLSEGVDRSQLENLVSAAARNHSRRCTTEKKRMG